MRVIHCAYSTKGTSSKLLTYVYWHGRSGLGVHAPGLSCLNNSTFPSNRSGPGTTIYFALTYPPTRKEKKKKKKKKKSEALLEITVIDNRRI